MQHSPNLLPRWFYILLLVIVLGALSAAVYGVAWIVCVLIESIERL